MNMHATVTPDSSLAVASSLVSPRECSELHGIMFGDLSANQLSAVYDAFDISRKAILGTSLQPRCIGEEDHGLVTRNEAGELLERELERISWLMQSIAAEARRRSNGTRREREDLATLRIQWAVECGSLDDVRVALSSTEDCAL